jgi:hypothetical protein
MCSSPLVQSHSYPNIDPSILLYLSPSGAPSAFSNEVERNITRKQTGLSFDKVAVKKGWHSREIKPKEFKGEEGHIALGVEGHLALG